MTIETPIIADKVNEDWLEKKVFCLIKKHSSEVWKPKEVLGTCCNADCPFCFPEEKPKAEPRDKVTVEERIADVGKTIDAPHKKITFDDMMKLIVDFCYDFIGDAEAQNYLLKRNLEYLVSLQGV